jgi:hypothetical protein
VPRDFARIGTDMPHEPSIKALDVGPAWLYDRLLMSRDMRRTGVVPYRPAVWADLAANATDPLIRKWIKALVGSRLIVVDEKYAELLVRTYVFHDHYLGQPNVVAALVTDFPLITSPLIQTALLTELRRILVADLLTPAEVGGWLLAMGHYPAATADDKTKGVWPATMTPGALVRLQKAMKNLSLAPSMTDAIKAGRVAPFPKPSTEALPPGLAEPFAGPPVRARAFTNNYNGNSNSTIAATPSTAQTPGETSSEVEVELPRDSKHREPV